MAKKWQIPLRGKLMPTFTLDTATQMLMSLLQRFAIWKVLKQASLPQQEWLRSLQALRRYYRLAIMWWPLEQCFGSTHQILTQILSKWGITHSYVEPDCPEDWSSFVQSNTKLLLVETPSNPGLTLVDLSQAGDFAKQHDLIFVVDNCFATPYIQQPIQYGADLVVHLRYKMDGWPRTKPRWHHCGFKCTARKSYFLLSTYRSGYVSI